jgi:hypothetical protein
MAASSTVLQYKKIQYDNFGQNIIIMFCKYLVDIWESLFGNP